MPRSILPGLAVCLLSVGFVAAAELKPLEVGKNPESVCRGFGGKLYVTLINGDDRKQEMRKIIEATGNADSQLAALQNEALKHLPGDDD